MLFSRRYTAAVISAADLRDYERGLGFTSDRKNPWKRSTWPSTCVVLSAAFYRSSTAVSYRARTFLTFDVLELDTSLGFVASPLGTAVSDPREEYLSRAPFPLLHPSPSQSPSSLPLFYCPLPVRSR